MSASKGYHVEPFGANRRMVEAAAAVNAEKHTIHLITEADITTARRLIAEHCAHTGERLSLTAYVVACLARTFDGFPRFNSFRQGSRLIVLEDLTISVLFEREIDGDSVPEPSASRRPIARRSARSTTNCGRRSRAGASVSAKRRERHGSASS